MTTIESIFVHSEYRRRVVNSPAIAISPGIRSAYIARDSLVSDGITSCEVEDADVVIFRDVVPEVPEPLRLPKTHAAPVGSPVQENFNALPAKPEIPSVVAPLEPGAAMLTFAGFAERAGAAADPDAGGFADPGTTATHKVTVCTRFPLVAKIVIGMVCATALE